MAKIKFWDFWPVSKWVNLGLSQKECCPQKTPRQHIKLSLQRPYQLIEIIIWHTTLKMGLDKKSTFGSRTVQKCDLSRAELTLSHGCSPVNWLNVERLSWKTLLGDCFYIYGSEYNRCQPAFTCWELKLEQGIK